MGPAITVEGLSKQYRVGEREKGYDTLRESLPRKLRSVFTRDRSGIFSRERMWALRDVSFEVQPGEVLGIIGRNGAGKTTLLRILTRISEPTEGRAEVRGRLASLLEVGTGFHPELTGRDNVFLNGAVLGMRRTEIARKFDEIVEFSGVEAHIDTPVKRYSSGMYVRLAFAVAAHLECELLLVDEVLAVGDIDFQRKCLGKMQEVSSEGRTVIFVSHNMAAIQKLCSRAILLESGSIAIEGNVETVTSMYLGAALRASPGGKIPDTLERMGTREALFTRVRLLDLSGSEISTMMLGQRFSVSLELDVHRPIRDAVLEVGISTLDGVRVCTALSTDRDQPPLMFDESTAKVEYRFDVVLLPGHFSVDIGLHHTDGTTIDWVERIADFEVLNIAEAGTDTWPFKLQRGSVRPAGAWSGPGMHGSGIQSLAGTADS